MAEQVLQCSRQRQDKAEIIEPESRHILTINVLWQEIFIAYTGFYTAEC